jgi:hypothetical protein
MFRRFPMAKTLPIAKISLIAEAEGAGPSRYVLTNRPLSTPISPTCSCRPCRKENHPDVTYFTKDPAGLP